MNMPAKLSTLQQEISKLTSQLVPARDDDIDSYLNALMDGGMMFPASIMAKDKIGEYRKALAIVPAAGLFAVVMKLKRGEYDNINLAFIPLPNEMAAMARAEAKALRENVLRLREQAKAIEEQNRLPEPRNEAMIERIRLMRAQVREQHAARKAIATIPQEPISDEKAEYYRSILALRDTGDVSAEQMAYRRVIAQEVRDSQPASDAQEPQA